MTVKELIEKLEKQNPLNEVFAAHYCQGADEIQEEMVEDVLEGSLDGTGLQITILQIFI